MTNLPIFPAGVAIVWVVCSKRPVRTNNLTILTAQSLSGPSIDSRQGCALIVRISKC